MVSENVDCLLLSLVSAPRSLPAKSMKEILPTTNPSSISPLLLPALRFKVNCRMQWLREESALAPVQPVLLDAELRSSNSFTAGTCSEPLFQSLLKISFLFYSWMWHRYELPLHYNLLWTSTIQEPSSLDDTEIPFNAEFSPGNKPLWHPCILQIVKVDSRSTKRRYLPQEKLHHALQMSMTIFIFFPSCKNSRSQWEAPSVQRFGLSFSHLREPPISFAHSRGRRVCHCISQNSLSRAASCCNVALPAMWIYLLLHEEAKAASGSVLIRVDCASGNGFVD